MMITVFENVQEGVMVGDQFNIEIKLVGDKAVFSKYKKEIAKIYDKFR